MALSLSVTKSPVGVTLEVSQKTFTENGGSIGRGDSNDWVLGDPDCFLSSRHCCVSFEDGYFYLTDTSTNGTFINSMSDPIGKGRKIPINDGDFVELGDYQFRISIQPDISIPDILFASSLSPVEPLSQENPVLVDSDGESLSRSVATAVGSAVLEGLGLDEKDFGEIDVDCIGELMPVIIEGVMKALRTRERINNEFRVAVPTIRSVEKNPLNYSANSQQAIDNMFLTNSEGCMAPQQAFKEGLEDICDHQDAVLVAIRLAFNSVIARFSPEQLERQLGKHNNSVDVPEANQNNRWDRYSDYYTEIAGDMESTFQYFFGEAFVKGYESQRRRLLVERNKKID